jgi:CBS domain-containing protein
MLFPIERLLTGRGKPLCVKQNQTVGEALALMVENDYSQLPIVDENGYLLGLISDEVILRRYYHIGGAVSLLDLTVDHCQTNAVTLARERDIFEALDRLQTVYAIVITEQGKPVGILTDFDLAHFFRDLTGDLLIVEDIETSLRQIIQTILPDEESMKTALIARFGEDSNNPGEPKKQFNNLTFGNLIYLIINEVNWPKFQPVFFDADLFFYMMDPVRQIRNQLAHFQGRADNKQHDALQNALQWLNARPKLKSYKLAQLRSKDVEKARQSRDKVEGGKYVPLKEYLENRKTEGHSTLSMGFDDIESLLGEELPDSARKHRSWWDNDYSTHPQASAWLGAGWLVNDLDLSNESVFFRQTTLALYPLFFDALLKQLKQERPGITRVSKASLQNWLSFSAGVPGFYYGWSLPREPILRVELYIELGTMEKTKAAFDALCAGKNKIEDEVGEPLQWERLEGRKASRIYAAKPFDFDVPEEQRKDAQAWGLKMMLKFIDTFRGRIRNLDR